MANPNSLLTRLRHRAVKILDVQPDKGEGWCVGCSLNGGKTLILPPDLESLEKHASKHGDKEIIHLLSSTLE